MKLKFSATLRVVVSISLIGLLIFLRRGSLGPVLEAIKRLETLPLILGCALYMLSIFIFAVRLKVLLHGQGLILSFPEVVYLTFIGLFFNNFLPTSIGGDVVKAYYASRKTDDRFNSFISVFMDRFIGFFSLFILAGISLIVSRAHLNDNSLVWMVSVMLFLFLVVIALFFNKNFARLFSFVVVLLERLKIRERIEKVYAAINAYRKKKRVVVQAFLISIIAQIACFSIMHLFSKGMGSPVSIRLSLILMPIVSIISMLPSINGLGVREGAIYFLFGPYVGYENALALSLLWLFMLFLAGIIGGVSYLFGTKFAANAYLKELEV